MIVRTCLRQHASLSSSSSTSTARVARRHISAASLAHQLRLPLQSYISRSRDPYLNLSIEHYFFENSAPGSVVLIQYINRPSVIIGRNQNPWLEVNLAALGEPRAPTVVGAIDLVRRRSGGGTVFHDEGNVNWSVICPASIFTRDKHAEMIVRGLRGCGVGRARVNERHDIVLDQGEAVVDAPDPDDTHRTPFAAVDASGPRPLKVSGSAYKLSRGRALHHGTCLLSSPNLHAIPCYLRSPAKSYISARGVESVSSPVTNIGLGNDDFIAAVQTQFANLYANGDAVDVCEVDDSLAEVESIKHGLDELKSREWTYSQTPQFTISNAADHNRSFEIDMHAKYGAITAGRLAVPSASGDLGLPIEFDEHLIGQKLHEITSWKPALRPYLKHADEEDVSNVCKWLQIMLPSPSGW